MLIGAYGTGKTILALQVAFQWAQDGQNVLYFTGYSESHDKLISHNRSFPFFVMDRVGREVQFASLTTLVEAGPGQTEEAIVAMARRQQVGLVVLDSFSGIRDFLSTDESVVHFIYSLTGKLALLGITTLVAIECDSSEVVRYPEIAVCDLIVALSRERRGSGQRRLLEVTKARGAAELAGTHPFAIGNSGIQVWPRLESLPIGECAWDTGRARFGVPALDTMLDGGLTVGTTSLIAGSPGVGKTLLGLHFIMEGARREEPGLFLGFLESAVQLRAKARVFGMDLEAAEAAGTARVLVLPARDLEADQIAALMRDACEQHGVRRIVVDSTAELERSVSTQERKPGFYASLVGYLRSMGITSCVTHDIPVIVGSELDRTDTTLSILAENLMLLRRVEYLGQFRQIFSVLKMRFSNYDRTIHEYAITAGRGMDVLGPAPRGAGLLSGVALPTGLPSTTGAPAGRATDVGEG